MRTSWIWVLFGVTCLSVLTVYFVIFHGDFSTFSQDWASFGGYVSGIMMPILTAINIWVFIKLTKTIDDNNSKRQQNDTKRQTDRHNEELAFQKRKIITDIRHQEIRFFDELFQKIGHGQNNHERDNIVAAIQNYLIAFRQTNQCLFTCEDILFEKIDDLIKELTNIRNTCGIIDMTKSVNLKAEISQLLWKHTVDNI